MAMAKTVLKFDEKELHRLTIPYKEYFGKMYISPEQMRSRMDLAEEIELVMLYVFAYWAIAEKGGIPIEEVKQDAAKQLRTVIARHTKLDPYLEKHISDVINEVVETTAKHADTNTGTESGESEADYWTSRERAMLIAENEANAFDNYSEYRDAASSGRKTKKWITELDDKVRLTHELAEGQTVDIDGLFLVGDSLMRFPMETMYDPNPKEIINCRCSCIYE
jgi:hypothetical protein